MFATPGEEMLIFQGRNWQKRKINQIVYIEIHSPTWEPFSSNQATEHEQTGTSLQGSSTVAGKKLTQSLSQHTEVLPVSTGI